MMLAESELVSRRSNMKHSMLVVIAALVMVMSVYSAAAQSAAAGTIRAAHSLALVETACWVFDKPSASSECQLAKWLNNCADYIQLYLQLHCLTPQHQCPTQRLSASALDSQWDLTPVQTLCGQENLLPVHAITMTATERTTTSMS
jgi:hypothetical protein